MTDCSRRLPAVCWFMQSTAHRMVWVSNSSLAVLEQWRLDSILQLWKHINKVLEKLVVAKLIKELPALCVPFMEPEGALQCSWESTCDVWGFVAVSVCRYLTAHFRKSHCLWNTGIGLCDLEDEGTWFCEMLVTICLVTHCHISEDLTLQGRASSIQLLVSTMH